MPKKTNPNKENEEELLEEALEEPEISYLDIKEYSTFDEITLMRLRAQLATKLLLVTKQIGALAKDGQNKHLGYDFISHFQITTAIRSALHAHKVLIMPNVDEHDSEDFVLKNNKGDESMWTRVRVYMHFDIIDADTGFMITVRWQGGEQDNQGKSFQQAVTICQKYFEMKLFHITDKNDVDPDSLSSPIEGEKKSGSTQQSEERPSDFFSSLPANLRYRLDKDKIWVKDGDILDAIKEWKKNPSHSGAIEWVDKLTSVHKFSRKNWKMLLTGLMLVDENGKSIPEQVMEEQKANLEEMQAKAIALKQRSQRVQQGVAEVTKAKSINELKILCKNTFNDIYDNTDRLCAPFITAVNKRLDELKEELNKEQHEHE